MRTATPVIDFKALFAKNPNRNRVVLHSDANCFYASVECLYNPDIRDKPVAVCGDPEARHGIVLTKNYIAKKYGIQTGEVIYQARKQCPDLVVVPAHYDMYRKLSRKLRHLYESYTDRVESYGLDECWVDVTGSSMDIEGGTRLANEIRERVTDELGITVSMGVSTNKAFSKLGSDMKKPNGTTVIPASGFEEKVWPLPVSDLLFVGPHTLKKFMNWNILTIGDLAKADTAWLASAMGKAGMMLQQFALGLDTTQVTASDADIAEKSIGNSTTTPRDMVNDEAIEHFFLLVCQFYHVSLAKELRKRNPKSITNRFESRNARYTLQIILTNHCNLHCKYCYVRRENIRSIPVDVAKNAISNMIIEHPSKEWMYDLCFMGGEPLVEFTKIKEISEWVWDTYPDIDIQISAPTNGTLLNKNICEWLEKNCTRFSLGLSYDGEYAQDDNRSSSAAMLNAKYFNELWPDQPFKMTISETNIEYLSQNVIELQEQGYRLAANVACGEPEWTAENIVEFGHQMLLLAQYYVDHPEIELVDLLNINLCQVFSYCDQMIRRCGIGFNYDTIDVDGSRCPCHLFSSLALTSQEINASRKYLMDKRNDFTIASCQKCVLNPLCPRCYGMAYVRTGDPFTVDINVCRLFRQQVKGACSYHLKRMSRLNFLSEKDHHIVCAIKVILGNLHFE